ncbi:MAG TPA: dipeptidyl carboxypeptidase II, partial [Planctomycetota bacterium]|nr:dipeptidyl carboxypeptidase II [Planctomycetota bacterium]
MLVATSLTSNPGALLAQDKAAAPATAAVPNVQNNPFMTASALPYQAPPFDHIKDSDYAPAIAAGMAQNLAEIATIAEQPAAPTFANTIEAMERGGVLLTRVSKVFSALAQSNTNDEIQQVQSDMAPKLAAHRDAIYLNAKLFGRVKAIFDQRDRLGLDQEQHFLVERYYRDFVRAGAQLSAADQTQLRALNQEESTLTTDFQKNLLAATKAAAVTVDAEAQLAGLSAGDLGAAAEAAKQRQLEGKWVLAMQNTTQQPVLSTLENRALRQRVLAASLARGDHGGTDDTRPLVRRLAELRVQKARLLGFPDYAS